MIKNFFCIFLFSVLIPVAHAQPISGIQSDRWKGFERVHFTIDGHEAYYVKPARPLVGNPWIWRASFPDWHTDMDSLLLTKGMYVVFVNVDDQYGSPAALRVWDELYDYLVDSLSFAAKASLEAVSRGGLYAYGWAKRNPDKVNSIYAEAPVCDIKSWPGGKGKGPGDSACWKQLLQVFSMTEKQAMAFDDNPVDHLEGLAAFKVPVLHVIGAYDKLVPSAENTLVLAQRYAALGGPVSIYPVTDGPQELEGHHFPIEHAEEWADFILHHAYPVKNPLPYNHYFRERKGLTDTYLAITQKKKATVAFLGGSITYNPGWRDKVCSWLKERFPATDFHFIAAGIPSLGSPAHAFRLQRDVLDSGKIDLLFVEAAVNDRVNGTDSITQIRSLEGIVRHAWKSNPSMDIVFLSFAGPEKIKDYESGISPVAVGNHERIAEYYGIPSVNLAKEVYDKIKQREFSWDYDFKDVHPAPYGQELYFATIKKLLSTCFRRQENPDRPATNGNRHLLPAAMNKGSLASGRYESPDKAKHDAGWTIDNDWTPRDGLPAREGFVNTKMLVSEKPGSVLTLSFTGTAVGMAIVSGSDAGTVLYSIDHGAFKEMDLFTAWSSFLHLPWYVLFGSDLKKGKHILTLKISGDKNNGSRGHACRIVYFLVND